VLGFLGGYVNCFLALIRESNLILSQRLYILELIMPTNTDTDTDTDTDINTDTDTNTEFKNDFYKFDLSKPVLRVLDQVGYETPSPIQAQTIPIFLEGRDILGQAQTGTGKTAAFALPLLTKLNLKLLKPQVLVLTPTRELAIQVAEAFQRYASFIKGFHIVPIYGGQEYSGQLRRLKRGVHVIVGTPGRLMDHMRRGTLKLDALTCLVLDEADEMLRMGFQQDVEWILEKTPEVHQTALFSATIPKEIRRISTKYLKDPAEITIKTKTTTVEATRQRYWMVSGLHKLDALTRILEAEPFDAVLVFVRTKTATMELSEKLQARGFAAAPINGDLSQNQRERTINNFKSGDLNILVGTDVAARGLDVDRISHVINFDIPYDTEAYVHRIGRTGRAGRSGEAILFVAPRERKLLNAIEKATKQKIELMEMPTTEMINDKRIAKFKQKITDTLAQEELEFFFQMVDQYQQEHNIPAIEVAGALAKLAQGETPLLLTKEPKRVQFFEDERPHKKKKSRREPRKEPRKSFVPQEEGMERFRIEVGHDHGVKPGNIVGAIANEAGLDSEHIGHIKIHDDFSTVDLPEGMPRDIFRILKKVWVSGQQLQISPFDDADKYGKKSEKPRRRKKDGDGAKRKKKK
jgi:ATP-dependent RNA helicase DeaD